MANHLHRIEFSEKDFILLYGSDYFCSSKENWMEHQKALKELCKKVCNSTFPIQVKHLVKNQLLIFNNKSEFDKWVKAHHPIKCEC